MITANFVRDLFTHMEWADARMWAADAVEHAAGRLPARHARAHPSRSSVSFSPDLDRRQAVQAFRKPDEFAALADVRAWAAAALSGGASVSRDA